MSFSQPTTLHTNPSLSRVPAGMLATVNININQPNTSDMNKARKQQLAAFNLKVEALKEQIATLSEDLIEFLEEELELAENVSENLQSGDAWESRQEDIENLEASSAALESSVESLSECIEEATKITEN